MGIVTITEGAIVLNPKDRGLCCVVRGITSDYFVLTPFTKHGWPSRDTRKWQYYHIDHLNTLKVLEKKGADKKLLVCPDCSKKGKLLFQAPLKKISIYDLRYVCQLCKEVFILGTIIKKGVK